MQSLIDVKLLDKEYVPSGHLVQDRAPASEYSAMPQLMHAVAPDSFPKLPFGHGVQSSTEARALDVEYVPAGHFVQISARLCEYSATPQRVQTVAPAASEKLPASHSLQLWMLVEPGVATYVPFSHWEHSFTVCL
eukprot:144936-Hanusia_phi.AAC.2